MNKYIRSFLLGMILLFAAAEGALAGTDGIWKATDQSQNFWIQTYTAGSALIVVTPDGNQYFVFLDPDVSDGFEAPELFGKNAKLTVIFGDVSTNLDAILGPREDRAKAILEIAGDTRVLPMERPFEAACGSVGFIPPFQSITRNFIASQQLTGDPINASLNEEGELYDGSVVLYATNQGRLGKLQVQQLDDGFGNLVIRYVTFDADGSVFSSQDNLVWSQSATLDLDAGVQGGIVPEEDDFFFQSVDGIVRFLNLKNGALALLLLAPPAAQDFESITRDFVASQALSNEDINVSLNEDAEVDDGSIVLYQTNAGRFGKLLVLDFRDDFDDSRIRYVTFDDDGSVFNSGDDLLWFQTNALDLETGDQGLFSDADDLFFENVDGVVRFWSLTNGALAAVYNGPAD